MLALINVNNLSAVDHVDHLYHYKMFHVSLLTFIVILATYVANESKEVLLSFSRCASWFLEFIVLLESFILMQYALIVSVNAGPHVFMVIFYLYWVLFIVHNIFYCIIVHIYITNCVRILLVVSKVLSIHSDEHQATI